MRTKSIKFWSIVAMTFICFIIMTLFGVLSYVNSKKSLEVQYEHEAKSVLNQTQLAFEYEFSNVEKLLNRLSYLPSIQNVKTAKPSDVNNLLRLYQGVSLVKGSLYYGVENGALYHGKDVVIPKGYNPVEQNWYHLSNNSLNRVVWTEPYLDYVTQDIIISALKTVKNKNGIVGVLVVNYSLKELSKQISSQKIGQDGLVMLLSGTGTILANRDNHLIGEALFKSQFKSMIKQTNADFITMSIQDHTYFVHSNTMKHNDMSIVTAISKDEINRALLKSHLPVFLVGLVSILLFGFVTYLAILRGLKPLNKLIGLMGRVENGDYDVHAKIKEYKEINLLAKGFNNMIAAIKKRDHELIVSNKELAYAQGQLRDKYEEIKAKEEKISRLASYDSLTELLNRRSLLEVLALSLESPKNTKLKAVIFIDLDNFKLINDSLGHSFGDKLLIEVASKLQSLKVLNKDVARISGDEFILVIHELETVSQIEEIVASIVRLFDRPIKVENRLLNVTGSIGVAIYPNHADSAEELLKIADMAMYRAKETGKNGYCIFDETIQQEVEEKLRIEKGIRESLKLNQFELFYQPLYSPQLKRIISVEALLRVKSGMLAGYNIQQIIKLAEVSGLIVDIDRWVLKEACRTIQQINEQLEEPVHISINISAINIMQQDFTQSVKRIVQQSGVPVDWIKLEITETSLMESFSLNSPKLYELQKMGINFHLDDFGTGYSSLNYLKTLPIEHVKIDKSFIDVMLQSEKDGKIVETIIQLAHNIGLNVVAEGIESEEQFNTLNRYQCDLLQGYYISRPLKQQDIIVKLMEINEKKLVNSIN